MQGCDDALIHVRSDWNDWHGASIRFDDLDDIHWCQPIGAPHAIVHGYISCSKIVDGVIPHWCDERSAPHRLHVCVLKKHTIPAVYTELVRRADAHEMRSEHRGIAAV